MIIYVCIFFWQEKVVVEIGVQDEKYDESNPLILCKKKKDASKSPSQPVIPEKKLLSRKQKKKLASILAKKKKKINVWLKLLILLYLNIIVFF